MQTASPAESELWPNFEEQLAALGPRTDTLPITEDPARDALDASGVPTEIVDDLDLLNVYVGWTVVDESSLQAGGVFDCADPEVLCASDRRNFTGDKKIFALAAMRTNGHIMLGGNRQAALTVALDRSDHDNAPPDVGVLNFPGYDFVIIANLDFQEMIGIEWDIDLGWVRTDPPARARIVGDTALLAIPVHWDGAATAQLSGQEHSYRCRRKDGDIECIGPGNSERVALDLAPNDGSLDPDRVSILGPP